MNFWWISNEKRIWRNEKMECLTVSILVAISGNKKNQKISKFNFYKPKKIEYHKKNHKNKLQDFKVILFENLVIQTFSISSLLIFKHKKVKYQNKTQKRVGILGTKYFLVVRISVNLFYMFSLIKISNLLKSWNVLKRWIKITWEFGLSYNIFVI